ncbi:protogloblin ApPgb [Scytonema tolypothrichoides VB-61278]|nr:protogloblin ApPgb [Scytonema tolypothrichoides VB-61278]
MSATAQETIPGYTYGTAAVGRSPITLDAFADMQRSVLFGPEDERALRQAGEVLADQVEAVLDVWYGFVGANPHLAFYFGDGHGHLNSEYLNRVRRRFGQWIIDTCTRPYDQAWLDYQHEIGLRHTAAKKNQTDQVQAVPVVHMRYIITFIYPITATIRPFLAARGHSPAEVEAMFNAWFKAVALQAALWCAPYVAPADY